MTTLETVISILEGCMGKRATGKISPEDSLFDDLSLDGDTFDEFLNALEEHYEFELDEDDIDTFDTVRDVVEYVESQLS